MFADNSIPTTKWMAAEIIPLIIGLALLIYGSCTNENQLAFMVVGGVLLLVTVLILVVNPSYFYYSDEDKQFIEIRTVKAFPFFRDPKGWKFPKSTLSSYEFSSALGGLQKFLTVTVKGLNSQTRKAETYTTDKINISIVSKDVIEKLEASLRKYARIK